MRIGRDLPGGAQNPSSRTAFLHAPPRPPSRRGYAGLAALGTAVTVPPELRASPAVICLVLTELTPTHDPGGELLGRYINGVTAALAESPRPKEVAGLTRAPPSASPDPRLVTHG